MRLQNADEAEIDNRRSIMADGRSEMSNASANSRRPTIDSNMSRDRSSYMSRDLNLLVAPTGNLAVWHENVKSIFYIDLKPTDQNTNNISILGAPMSNAGGGLANLRRQWSVRSENRSIIPATQRQISLQTSGTFR